MSRARDNANTSIFGTPSVTLGSDATGDVYYRAAGGALTRLATGADGTVLTSTGAAAVPAFEAAGGVTGRNEGLVVKYVSDATVDIDADYLTLFDSSNLAYIASSVNLSTSVFPTVGINGLDTGSEATIWYHIYVIYNGTTIASLLSASATSPTMPSGYTYKKYVGAVYNGSGSFRDFSQQGNEVSTTTTAAITSGTATSYSSLSLSTIVPSTAKNFSGYIFVTRNLDASSGYFYMATTSSGLGSRVSRYYHATTGLKNLFVAYSHMPIETAQTTYWKVQASGDSGEIDIAGFAFHGIV